METPHVPLGGSRTPQTRRFMMPFLTSPLLLGIGVAGVCAVVVAALILRSRRATERDKLTDAQRAQRVKERRDAWRRGLSIFALGVGCLMLFAIAGTAGWLSFGAQREYAASRNGGSWAHATGFALLLDAGALGLSLFRFFEALTLRSSMMTRLFLVGFIGSSSAMNYLHAPREDFGGRFVAIVPPLVYAVLLEMLLHKIEQVVMGKRPKRRSRGDQRGYSLLLWLPWPVGAPVRMWQAWRKDLLDTITNVRAPGSRKLPAPAPATAPAGVEFDVAAVEEESGLSLAATPPSPAPGEAARPQPAPAVPGPAASVPPTPVKVPVPMPARVASPAPTPAEPTPAVAAPAPPIAPAIPAPREQTPLTVPVPPPAPTSGRVSKKDRLRQALIAQLAQGDLRVLSEDAVVKNAAAYQANIELGQADGLGKDRRGELIGLMDKTAARNALNQLLPELREIYERARAEAAAARAKAAEPAPVHQAPSNDGDQADSRVREGGGSETDTGSSAESKEASYAA
ncbi:DUF2637 domain-containing protein [Streptomyces syringium]|uniref:DUF2637 domain-containing protein n=1 Tax=Streptomyces syringium TaxID=76729 RepID=UPI0037D1FB82